MQIVEINEPNKFDQKDEIVVGIDFGTTNSLIAFSKNYKPKIIGDDDGIIPSVIFYDNKNHEFLIGNDAKIKDGINSIKRLLAKSYDDIKSSEVLSNILSGIIITDNEVPKIQFGDKYYSFPELAAKIFEHLKKIAEWELGKQVTKAVISVPAYFDDASRGAVLLAAKIAGLDVLRLIAEPTAAAYAYGLENKYSGTYMVYDLGGGTFDVSILNIQAGILQVIATGGDNLLGGDDLDHIIAKHIAKEFNSSADQSTYELAKRTKEKLSRADRVIIGSDEIVIDIWRDDFEKLIKPVIDKTLEIAKNTLFDAQVELDGIILVGGSTRIPMVKNQLLKSFGEVPIFADINPDKVVAMGAALQAENLSKPSKSGSLLIDVVPLSLGLELYGGIVEKIILRNSPIPCFVTRSFTTHVDMQTGIKLHIVQGEREMAKDCRSLARFELKNIAPMKAGMIKLEVTFAIDADGILSVTAREAESGVAHNIEIKPTYGLTEQEISILLEHAFKNAEQDHVTRLLTEARIEAKNLIFGIKRAIKQTPDILSKTEEGKIISLIETLQECIIFGTREDILSKVENLNKLTTNFIQKHLDKGAKLILEGHHIDDI